VCVVSVLYVGVALTCGLKYGNVCLSVRLSISDC